MNSSPSPIQFFDPASHTYTYLLIDPKTRDAVIIDPVDSQLSRDLGMLQKWDAKLCYVIETHAHADHITSAASLIEHTGAVAATPEGCNIKPSAIQLKNNQVLSFGSQTITALHTPGHTTGSMCFLWQNHVFTGDTLLIDGCGRTDFQSGSAQSLYLSLTTVLLCLPGATKVWPGHDYKGRSSSTISAEKASNSRLTANGKLISIEAFTLMMGTLNLPRPKRIDEALPANLSLGLRQDAGSAVGQVKLADASAGYAGDISVQLAFEWWQNGDALLVDIRSNAERAWVGFIPDAPAIEWKMWPGMEINPEFDQSLMRIAPKGSKLMMLCRSSLRSVPSAQRATSLGYEAYNILEGFEGDPDSDAKRNNKGGWRFHGLPWRQN